jgi:hypothetical protein
MILIVNCYIWFTGDKQELFFYFLPLFYSSVVTLLMLRICNGFLSNPYSQTVCVCPKIKFYCATCV